MRVWSGVLGRHISSVRGQQWENGGFPGGSDSKRNLPVMKETQIGSLGWEDPLEKGMATYSSILAGEIPWTEEPVGTQRAGHD